MIYAATSFVFAMTSSLYFTTSLVHMTVHLFVHRVFCYLKDGIQCFIAEKPLIHGRILKELIFLHGKSSKDCVFLQTFKLHAFGKVLPPPLLCTFIGFLYAGEHVIKDFCFISCPFLRGLSDTGHRVTDVEVGRIIHASGVCGISRKIRAEHSIFNCCSHLSCMHHNKASSFP